MRGSIVSRFVGTILGAAIAIAGLAATGFGVIEQRHPSVKYAVAFRLMDGAAATRVANNSNMD